jgi:hypothetical protein
MAGRKIRDEADARACLAGVGASRLGLAGWARREGVDGRSLNLWRMNLARRAARSGPRLVELVPRPEPTPRAARYVVRRGELAVEVGEDFDEDVLFRLLQVVAAC